MIRKWRVTPVGCAPPIHQTRAYIRYLLRQYRSCAPGTFVIALLDTGKVIGTIGFMWVQTENRSAEVGYSLSRAYLNRGFMTEALTCVLEFDSPASTSTASKPSMSVTTLPAAT